MFLLACKGVFYHHSATATSAPHIENKNIQMIAIMEAFQQDFFDVGAKRNEKATKGGACPQHRHSKDKFDQQPYDYG